MGLRERFDRHLKWRWHRSWLWWWLAVKANGKSKKRCVAPILMVIVTATTFYFTISIRWKKKSRIVVSWNSFYIMLQRRLFNRRKTHQKKERKNISKMVVTFFRINGLVTPTWEKASKPIFRLIVYCKMS